MGLRKTFQSIETIAYRLAADIDPTIFGQFNYAPDLITPPRIYGEEISHVGAVWGAHDPNLYGPSSVSFIAPTRQVYWPSWDISRWRLDGQEGHQLSRDLGTALTGPSVLEASYPRFAVEPGTGAIWWYGDPYVGRAVLLDAATLAATSIVIPVSDYSAISLLPVFAVDRAADRVFIRRFDDDVGHVTIYRLSTKAKIADIFVPGEARGIVLTHDGFAYVHDTLEWLCCYDYDGRLFGAMKNRPAAAATKGTCYGWDHYYKRLLRVAGTAPAVDGASTMRVEGYYPQPEAWTLSPPIAAKVPRVGRTIYSVAHLAGEGGEPLAGRRVAVTAGGVARTASTDANGDAAAPVAPVAAGALLVEVTE